MHRGEPRRRDDPRRPPLSRRPSRRSANGVEQGHFIHITSHRASACAPATARWLERLGLPFDDLCCSYDKVSRCVELDIDILIDDSPLNISAAIEHGIAAATILHPWNAELCEVEDVLGAHDWPELAQLLAPVLCAPNSTLLSPH